MEFDIKCINVEQLKQLNLDQDTLNVINAAIAPEFAPLLDIINTYDSKRNEFKNIYNDDNDVRIMFFTKILNTLYSYFLERVLINGLVDSDDNIKNYLQRINLSPVVKNWDTFKISHNFYNAFTCYIRLFSCLESSLREIHNYLNLNASNNFSTFYNIYHPLITNNALNSDYENLLNLLATIRNLIHNMGICTKNVNITYNGTTYQFIENQIPSKDVLNLINILDLFKTDVLNFISELFNSSSIRLISNMPDNLSSDSKDYDKWILKQ